MINIDRSGQRSPPKSNEHQPDCGALVPATSPWRIGLKSNVGQACQETRCCWQRPWEIANLLGSISANRRHLTERRRPCGLTPFRDVRLTDSSSVHSRGAHALEVLDSTCSKTFPPLPSSTTMIPCVAL